VFTIPERSFKLIVIFFGLTNSLVMFQTMMNETEEEYKEIVKEVVKRLAENDLYIKLKKIQAEGKESRVFRSSNRTREN